MEEKLKEKKDEKIASSAGEQVAPDVSSKDIIDAFLGAYGKKATPEDKKRFGDLFPKRLKQEVAKHDCAKKYNILIIFDNTIIVKSDSDKILSAISKLERNKPLLLILVSNGGEPGPAYLIGKLCQESSNGKFIIVVPRHAKSAATLLSTAADEIHMGSLSELGPIDPQINGMPTLGLKNSIEDIAELVNKMPGAAEMFARYLSRTIEPIQIGYYERAAKSAKQYAERLLENHASQLSNKPTNIAHILVYEYKDHGFVIDKSEAEKIFGNNTIKNNSEEYQLGNTIYNELSTLERLAKNLEYSFYLIGCLDSEPTLFKRAK